jgi:hypothetical protein
VYSLCYVALGNSTVVVDHDQWLIRFTVNRWLPGLAGSLQTLDVAFLVDCFSIVIGLGGLSLAASLQRGQVGKFLPLCIASLFLGAGYNKSGKSVGTLAHQSLWGTVVSRSEYA